MTDEIKKLGEEPAFPLDPQNQWANLGLTKREYFAAMALQGFLASFTVANVTPKLAAEKAVEYADALLKALNDSK